VQAATVPAHGRGWVPPAEMGPRPLSSVEYVDEVEVEHAGGMGGGATEDEGTLEMPTFVLDTAPDDAPAYTLQVKAFREQEQADAFLGELRAKGYDAWVVHSDIPDKGVWYRVRVGHFSTLGEATGFQESFDDKENLSTFVSSL
jgi:cell division septation protein DedD